MTGQPCSSSSTGNSNSGTLSSGNTNVVAQFNSLLQSGFTLGTNSGAVKPLQQFLQTQGYYFGKVDGRYGKITARAVSDFEADNNINVSIPAQTTNTAPTPTASGNINTANNLGGTTSTNVLGATASVSTLQTPDPISLYDYNHNGVIDQSDLTFALQVATGINGGNPCPSDRKCTLNTLDLVAIRNILASQ